MLANVTETVDPHVKAADVARYIADSLTLGYALANVSGEALKNLDALEREEGVFGLLRGPRRKWFGIFPRRRQVVAQLWMHGWKAARARTWVLEVYGRAQLLEIRHLAEELSDAFGGRKIAIQLGSEKHEWEVFSWEGD